MWAYQGNELAVQWSAWLRRTRADPPTLEELQADRIRQIRLQNNVMRLKQEYAEEKERLRLSQTMPEPGKPVSALPGVSSQQQPSPASSSSSASPPPHEPATPPRPAQQPKEAPQPWKAQETAAKQAQSNTRQLEHTAAQQEIQKTEEAAAKASIKRQKRPQQKMDQDRPGARALKNNRTFSLTCQKGTPGLPAILPLC